MFSSYSNNVQNSKDLAVKDKIKQRKLSQGLLIFVVALLFFSIPFLPALFTKSTHYGLPTNRPAPDFKLQDVKNQLVSLADYQGKFVILMFGYLNCNDVCHSQALIFQEINHLADMPDKLHFLYIGMDPERDTAKQLAAYFDGRGKNFTSLRGNKFSDLQALANDYSAHFSRGGMDDSGDYEIRHKGFYFLIGPDGHIRQTYTATQRRSGLIVGDLMELKQKYKRL